MPAPVMEVLGGLGSVDDPRPTEGGFSNLTFAVDIDGEARVVKAAMRPEKREDLRRETAMLELFAKDNDGLPPLPELKAVLENDEWTICVLSFIVGTPGLNAVRASAASLSAKAVLLGRAVRMVHQAALQPDPRCPFDHATDIAGLAEGLEARLAIAEVPEPIVLALMTALDDPAHRAGAALCHGDVGLHNTLWSGRGRTIRLAGLIDWELAGWGNPLGDLAWAWWTMRFRTAGDAAFRSFLEGYGAGSSLSLGWRPAVVRNLVLAKMALLLDRARSSADQRDEWLRRIDQLTTWPVPAF